MKLKVAINGFGRIGKLVFRAGIDCDEIEFVGINDLAEARVLAHLLRYDSVHGTLDRNIKVEDDIILFNGKPIKAFSVKHPSELRWSDLGVDVVVEATGKFCNREAAAYHLSAGAKAVIITAPAQNPDVTIVMGVNNDKYIPDKHKIISAASCTTNCLAILLKVLHEEFNIEYALMTTVHAYTNDQPTLDLVHKDIRRARAATLSMIPTKTGAAVATEEVLPELSGRLYGIALRVPVPNVSIVDLTAILSKNTDRNEINAVFKEKANGELKNCLFCSEAELVSSDYNHSPYSAIVDLPLTKVIGGNKAKVFAWYDNEWGYSNRVIDLLKLIHQKWNQNI